MNRTKQKKKKVVVHHVVYAEREYFSPRHKWWTRYHVKRPRLPIESDSNPALRWIDTKYQPKTLRTFVGNNNHEIIASLLRIRDQFELTTQFPSLMVVYGPEGSGKTGLVRALFFEIAEYLGLEAAFVKKYILHVDCKNIDVSKLWNKIGQFVDQAEANTQSEIKSRFVCLDNADMIPPSAQQILKKILQENEDKIKFVFICKDKNKLIGHILGKAQTYQTKIIAERDALSVILSVCCRDSIGYNREGIQELFKLNTPISMSRLIDNLQDIFVKYSFISAENVRRYETDNTSKVSKLEISTSTALEPFSRCSICTLYPPCKHLTLQQMEDKGKQRRLELPRNKQSPVCSEFQTEGYCSLFNKFGRCVLDHPPYLHRVIPLPKRCSQCTLIWPCNHCSYSVERNKLNELIEMLKARLELLNKISVPNAPLALVAHLVEYYPDYAAQLQQLKFETTLEKEKILRAAEAWCNETMSIIGEDYAAKYRSVYNLFRKHIETPLLEPYSNYVEIDETTIETTEEGAQK